MLDARIKDKGLFDKSDVSKLVKSFDLSRKLATLIAKGELELEQDKTAKLQAFDSNYFGGTSHFEDDGTEICLVF